MGRKSNTPPGSPGDIVATTEQLRREHNIPLSILVAQAGYDRSDYLRLQNCMVSERQRACATAFRDALAELIVSLESGIPIAQWRYQQRYGYVPMFASKKYRRF